MTGAHATTCPIATLDPNAFQSNPIKPDSHKAVTASEGMQQLWKMKGF